MPVKIIVMNTYEKQYTCNECKCITVKKAPESLFLA